MSGATLLYKVAAAYPDTDASGSFGFLWSTDASKPDNSPPAPSCVVYLGTGLSIVEATDAPIPAPVAVAPEWPEWMVTNNLQPVATVYANTIDTETNPGQAVFSRAKDDGSGNPEYDPVASVTIQPGMVMVVTAFVIP